MAATGRGSGQIGRPKNRRTNAEIAEERRQVGVAAREQQQAIVADRVVRAMEAYDLGATTDGRDVTVSGMLVGGDRLAVTLRVEVANVCPSCGVGAEVYMADCEGEPRVRACRNPQCDVGTFIVGGPVVWSTKTMLEKEAGLREMLRVAAAGRTR